MSKVRFATQERFSIAQFIEKEGASKIVNYGDDNKFPTKLWDYYLNCSIHQAIIDGSVDYVMGEGVTGNQLLSVSDVRKLIFDFRLFGGFAIEVIYDVAGVIRKAKHVDFAKCRVNKGENTVFVAQNWGGYNRKITELDAFNPYVAGRSHQILYYKGKKAKGVYPFPSYIGSLAAIETEIEIQNYHLNAIKNNFSVSAIISFNGGIPTDAEQEELMKGLKDSFTGTDNAASFACLFNNSKEDAVTVERLIDDKTDAKFTQLAKDTKENIFIGHRVTSGALFGLVSESTGFNATEYNEAFKLYNKTVIQPLQREFIEAVAPIDTISFEPFQIPL